MDDATGFKRTMLRLVVISAAMAGVALVQATAALAAPGNDNLPGSLLSTAGTWYAQASESTSGATTESGEQLPNHIGATVWYRWAAPDYPVQVTATTDDYTDVYGSHLQSASSFDTVLNVYQFGFPLSFVTGNDDDGNGLQSTLTFDPTPSTIYYFQAGGFGGDTGNLNFLIATQPVNDNFANATALSGLGSTFDGTLNGATHEAGEFSGFLQPVSVWYAYTPSKDGYLTASLSNEGSQVVMGVWQGSSASSVTAVTSSNGTSITNLKLSGGQTYYLRVQGIQHDFTLQWRYDPVPDNNDFANAQAISGTSGSVSGTTYGANLENGEPIPFSLDCCSVWYSWTAPESGWVTPTLTTGAGHVGFDIQQGPDVAHLTSVAFTGQFHAVQGQVYYYQMIGLEDTFTLSWSEAASPANDDFANAQTITKIDGSPGNIFTTTSQASGESGEPNVGSNTISVWYSWTPTVRGRAQISVPSSASVEVFTGSSLSSLNGVAGPSSTVSFPVTPNTTYVIQVLSQMPGSTFNMAMVLYLSPSNDDFADAQVIGGTSGSVDGTTYGSNLQAGEPTPSLLDCCSVWYAWTAPETGWVTPTLTTGASMVGFDIEQGPNLTHLTPVAFNGEFHATQGQVYYYQMVGRQDTFTLGWSEVASPANDDFANAQVVTKTDGSPGSIPGTTSQASGEQGEPNVGSNTISVWYSWTPTVNGDAQISVGGGDSVEVFTGSSVGSLDAVDGPAASLSFRVVKNTTYVIQLLSTSPGATFNLSMALDPAPANDDFADAAPFPMGVGTAGDITGTLAHAGSEPGEPNADGQRTVWYSWTPSLTGASEIVSVTSGVQVAVYTGTSVGSLTSVVDPTDDATWIAQAGQSYMIQVSTPGPGGSFELQDLQSESALRTFMSGPATGTVGSQLTYSEVVTNGGPQSTTAKVDLTPSFPVRLNSFTSSATCVPTGDGGLSCSKLLGNGGSFSVKYRIGAPRAGALQVASAVTSLDDNADPLLADNTSSIQTLVKTVATTRYTAITDDGFPDATINAGQVGNTVFWNNAGPSANEVQDASGLGLFGLHLGAPVDFGSFQYWASGKYLVQSPPDDTTQTITVPLKHSPAAGGVSTVFVLTWAAFQAPTGYQYELDIKRPLTTLWRDWETTGLKSGSFTPDSGTGTYQFRMRLFRPGTLLASGWVTTSIVVS